MVGYKVHIQDNEVVIELKESGFKMRVFKADSVELKEEKAILEATQYIEKTSVIPWSSYMFEASEYSSLEELDMDIFKSAIAFYFNSVLNTDLFVISVPRASLLCPTERKLFIYDKASA